MRRSLALLSLSCCPLVAQGDHPTPKPTDEFEVPAGCAVQLFAESPRLYNPTAIDVDHRGRVWVTEAVNYRGFRNKGKRRFHEKGDRVVILEDTDGDGKCDESKVFAQEKDLLSPLGICVIGPHVLVSCSPHAILYTDTDGDDVPDKRELLLSGFGGRDHDHGLHSFTAGPDGYLYFNAGNAGPHIVADKSGWNLRSRNNGGLKSDDGRTWIQGLVMRVRPDGTGLRVLAHNFRNPYEVAVDAFGNLFQSDNDDDGNQGCRTSWVMEGGNYGYASEDGRRSWRADQRPGQSKWIAHWHQDDPGVVPAGASNGGGGPTGVAIYEGPSMPGCPVGTVLNCDAGAGVVYGHVPKAVGAGFELRKTIFMQVKKGTGGKRERWFRPSDVVVGTDGTVFVADWYDPGVGGHAAGDRAAYGRILRVLGPNARRMRMDLDTVAGLADALHNPSPNVRGLAFRRLLSRGQEAQDAVAATWTDAEDVRRRARALGWLAGTADGTSFVERGLADADPDIRIAAIRAARTHTGARDAWTMVRGLASDASPAVRREVLLAAAAVPLPDCEPELLKLGATLDADDRFLVEAFGIAARGRESRLYTRLMADIGDQPAKWSDRMAVLAWRLHPVESVRAHLTRAMTTDLHRRARERSIDAIAFVKGKAAAQAMLQIASAGPEDTRALAAFWLQHRGTNDWARHGLARFVSKRKDAKLLWRSGLMQRGSKRFDVEVQPGRTLWLVVSDGGNGYGCDWADWVAPEFVTSDRTIPLRSLRWSQAKTGWGNINIDKNAGGGILSFNGKRKLRGIGTHAPSEIVYEVPVGARRFRGRVGPDFGGTSQGCGTSIEFEIYLQEDPEHHPVAAWRAQILDASTKLDSRATTAQKMAQDRAGGVALLGLIEQGKLPKELMPAVEKAIFRNPDRSVRLLASKYFDLPGLADLDLPSIEKLAAMKGDAKRGSAHFAKVCATCHLFRGTGKDVGPELSQIHRKYGTAALLESILNPDAAISFGYENWVIEKKDGEFLIGFILAEGENVVIKDQEGRRHILAAADIASKQRSETSLMPASLVAGMKAQDLADLAAYLLREPHEDLELGEPIRLFNGRDLTGWTFYLRGDAKPEDVWSVEDGVLVCRGRPAGYIRTEDSYTNYVLTLKWRFDGKPGNSGVLLRMVGPDKVWPKSIEAQLQHRNAGDFWNIDRFRMEVDASRTRGRHTRKMRPCNERPLGEWNDYEIVVDHGDVTLIVNGVVQNRATGCAEVAGKICLQSEGAPIQFKEILLRPIR